MKILKKFQKLSKPVRIAIVALAVFIVAEIITVSSLSSDIAKNASSYAPSAQAETLPAQTITTSSSDTEHKTSDEQTSNSDNTLSSDSGQNSDEANSSTSGSDSSTTTGATQTSTQNSVQSQNSAPASSSSSSSNSSSAPTSGSNSSTSSNSSPRPNSNSGSTQSQTQPSTPAQPQQSQTAIKDPMSGIKIAEAENVPYDRKAYQPSWDVGSGCNIRARILQSTSIINYTTAKNGCTVTYGSWNDLYTGKVLTGNPYQGDGTANDLDIDHVIPLNYVNSHGGYYWSATAKRAYGSSLTGMNNGVYLAVSSSENRKKSDKGPASYYPPNPAYRCTYAKKWRDLARLYQISLSAADYNVVKNVLISCNIN